MLFLVILFTKVLLLTEPDAGLCSLSPFENKKTNDFIYGRIKCRNLSKEEEKPPLIINKNTIFLQYKYLAQIISKDPYLDSKNPSH